MAENRKVKIETYNVDEWDEVRYRKFPYHFHEFGIEQNKYNRIIVNRLRKAESENRQLNLDMQQQTEYYEQKMKQADEQAAVLQGQIDILTRQVEELIENVKILRKEADKMRLAEKLNTNSIDRIMRKLPDSIDVDIE